MSLLKALSTGVLLAHLAAAGCGPSQAQFDKVKAELFACREDSGRLTQENQSLQQQIAAQQRQIQTLQDLGGTKRIELLFRTERIELTAGTTGIDTDGKPGHDAVKAYLRPIDQQGSVIKAAGSATVRLYDLAADEGQTLLGECTFGPEELAKNWYSGFVSYDYILTCPLAKPPAHAEITVWVEFTDYLTGKTFTAQRVVNVNLAP